MTRPIALLVLSACLVVAPARAGAQDLGYFEASGDVGQPAISGSAKYDDATQTYTITGAGTNMWASRDEFQFVWRKLNGDFILLGALVSFAPETVTNTFGNGNAQVLFSSAAMSDLPGASGSSFARIRSWQRASSN